MDASDPTLRLEDLITRRNPKVSRLLKEAKILLTFNARGALYRLLGAFPPERGRIILVPGFHCVSVVEPILRAGYRVLFYKISEDLSIDYNDLYAKLSHDIAAVIIINYFGFPADIDGILAMRERYDYYVIEDWAHSFLSGTPERLTGEKGDAAIFSFRKLVPSYAGGGLRINTQELACDMQSAPVGPGRSIVILKRLLEQIFENLDEGFIKSSFRYCEHKRVTRKKQNIELSAPVPNRWLEGSSVSHDDLATAKLPWLSKLILHLSDFGSIISARQKNYRILNQYLEENRHLRKVFSDLPAKACPWAYPVWLQDRGEYDYRLRNIGIPVFTFGDVLHPYVFKSDSGVVSSATSLSKNLMLIPIQQNLSEDVVGSFSQKINSFFRDLDEN